MDAMKVGPVLILLVFFSSITHSQPQSGNLPGSAKGSLTVTATVESSVFLVIEPDGRQQVVVANAPDPKESFYRPPASKSPKSQQEHPGKKTMTSAQKKTPAPIVPEQQRGRADQGEGPVVFSFPAAPAKFEVTQETKLMDVTDGGKTERRAVQVTTVVAR
jgi:hypothetical protein